MLVSVSSVRGAPGVSAWALMLAAAWPHDADRVVVEADGSGGIVGARYDLPIEPGVSDLLSQVRRGTFNQGFQMDSVARLLRRPRKDEEGLWVVPGPLSSYDAQAAWVALAKPAASAMNADHRLWVVDCGRVWASSPIELLMTTASLNIVISDASVPSLIALQSRVQAIPGKVALIIIGKTKHTVEELTAFTGAATVWNIPYYRALAERAGQVASEQRRGRRSKAWQTALKISHALSRESAWHLESSSPSGVGPDQQPQPPVAGSAVGQELVEP